MTGAGRPAPGDVEMTGASDSTTGPPDATDDGSVRVRCQADRRVYGIDVEWMKGAVFEFDSEAAARDWVVEQNRGVPGLLRLEEARETEDGFAVDYNLKYDRSK